MQTDSSQFLWYFYQVVTYVSAITYYLTATINPILYQLMSLKFRLAFKETFGCWFPFLRWVIHFLFSVWTFLTCQFANGNLKKNTKKLRLSCDLINLLICFFFFNNRPTTSSHHSSCTTGHTTAVGQATIQTTAGLQTTAITYDQPSNNQTIYNAQTSSGPLASPTNLAAGNQSGSQTNAQGNALILSSNLPSAVTAAIGSSESNIAVWFACDNAVCAINSFISNVNSTWLAKSKKIANNSKALRSQPPLGTFHFQSEQFRL